MHFFQRSFPSIPSRSRRRRGTTKGFSLIEMLVAVAIVGLLVGLVGTAAIRQLQTSRVNTTEAQINQIRGAIDIFSIDTGRVPTENEGIAALVSNVSNISGWNGPYLRDGKIPVDAWSNAFIYSFDGTQVRVISLGADGQEGGTGNNADISG